MYHLYKEQCQESEGKQILQVKSHTVEYFCSPISKVTKSDLPNNVRSSPEVFHSWYKSIVITDIKRKINYLTQTYVIQKTNHGETKKASFNLLFK